MNKETEIAVNQINELRKYCQDNKIPFFAVIMDDTDDEKYYSAVVTPTVVRREIQVPDKITKFNAAMNNNFYIKVAESNSEEMADMMDSFLED